MTRRQILLPIFILCVLVSLLLVFFTTDKRGYIQTIFSGPQTIFLHLSQIFSTPTSKLQKENADLNEKLAKMNLLKADNASLHDQFLTANSSHQDLLPSQIVGMPSFLPGFSMPENYILHVGKKEKVYINYPVVFKENLVGRVVQIEDHFSKVILISNKKMSFSAKTTDTQANGIIRGTGNGGVIFDNVLLSDSLKVGDIVVTSGEVDINGKGFPPDLIVGKITSVEKNPSNLFQKASIMPLMDFKKLTNVFILMPE